MDPATLALLAAAAADLTSPVDMGADLTTLAPDEKAAFDVPVWLVDFATAPAAAKPALLIDLLTALELELELEPELELTSEAVTLAADPTTLAALATDLAEEEALLRFVEEAAALAVAADLTELVDEAADLATLAPDEMADFDVLVLLADLAALLAADDPALRIAIASLLEMTFSNNDLFLPVQAMEIWIAGNL